MRHLSLLALLLPACTLAAEPLNNSRLERSYIPAPPCQPPKDKKNGEDGCDKYPDNMVRQQSVQDAEHLTSNPSLTNPKTTDPTVPLPPPPPEPQVTPLQQQIIQKIEQLPVQPPR